MIRQAQLTLPTPEDQPIPTASQSYDQCILDRDSLEATDDHQVEDVEARSRCLEGRCLCRCHATWKVSRRFWSIELSNLAGILSSCDRPQCKARRYSPSCRIALSRLGIPLAILVRFDFICSASGYSIALPLHLTPIVPYTAEGFQVLWKAEKSLITCDEAVRELGSLFRDRKISPRDVDPAGEGWLEVNTMGTSLSVSLANLFPEATCIPLDIESTATIYDSSNLDQTWLRRPVKC